jgi:hypothetical protein
VLLLRRRAWRSAASESAPLPEDRFCRSETNRRTLKPLFFHTANPRHRGIATERRALRGEQIKRLGGGRVRVYEGHPPDRTPGRHFTRAYCINGRPSGESKLILKDTYRKPKYCKETFAAYFYPFTKFFIEFEIRGGHCASIAAPPIRLSPRMAALEVSLAAVACRRSTIGGDVERLESAGSRYGAARPGGEATRGAVVRHARVFLLRIGRGEEIEEPGRGTSPAPASLPAR